MPFVLFKHSLDISVGLLRSGQNPAILYGNPLGLIIDRENLWGILKQTDCFMRSLYLNCHCGVKH